MAIRCIQKRHVAIDTSCAAVSLAIFLPTCFFLKIRFANAWNKLKPLTPSNLHLSRILRAYKHMVEHVTPILPTFYHIFLFVLH